MGEKKEKNEKARVKRIPEREERMKVGRGRGN